MNEQRIREIASQCSDFAEQIPYFRGIEDGLTWEAKIQKARDFKFAELIVQECILVIEEEAEHIHAEGTIEAIVNLEKHFGVE